MQQMFEGPALTPRSISLGLIIHTLMLTVFYTASSAPTPLYQLYQVKWSLSAATLTLIFGVYPLAMLGALLVGGKISDHVGRKPIIYGSTVIAVLSTIMMLFADGAGWLIASRVILGLATGVGSVALGAALIDLDVQKGSLTTTIAPIISMAIGAFGTAALIQLAPAPFQLVFILLIGAFALLLALTIGVPETAQRRPGAIRSLAPSIAVPRAARGALLAITPFNIAMWALGGFLMSLMPGIISKATGSSSAWLGGATVAMITITSVIATLAMNKVAAMKALLIASALLGVGMGAILIAASSNSAILFVLGCLCAGFGTGAGFLGAIRCIMPLAEPSERAGLMAAFFVVAYLTNSLAPMAAGYLAGYYDLMLVANGYGLVVIALAALSFAVIWTRYRDAGSRRSVEAAAE